VARAEAHVPQACTARAETAIDARSEVREAYGAYRTAWDIARHHRDEIVPLRQRIAEENLLRYNGMLIGVFELLADARAQIASVNAPSRRCATSGWPRPTWTWPDRQPSLPPPPPAAAAAAAAGARPLTPTEHEDTTWMVSRRNSSAARRRHHGRAVAAAPSARWRWPRCPSP
jgi:hypothetical protein